MSDRLALSHVIEETAGLDRPKAERLASAIFEAIHEGVATKADIAQLRLELNAKIDLVEHRLLTRLGGLMVVLWAALVAALHLWPPGH